jgi:DNA processing protein
MLTKTVNNDPSTLPESQLRTRIRNALRLAYHPALKPAQRMALAKTFGSAQLLAQADRLHLESVLKNNVDAWLNDDLEQIDAWEHACFEWLQQPNRHLISWGDANYPSRLKHLPDPPMVLFAHGNLNMLGLKTIAMVGSRSASKGGLQNAFNFSCWLAGRGWCIVSGLAAGIDGASHEGALSINGPTIAVMGTGIDTIYPREHQHLSQLIVGQGGLLVSEYPPGTPPRKEFFPRRNRIIAALSHGLVVVEAALRSGSLITARQASELGRVVMAVPGSIHSTHAHGCHEMIRKGATLVNNAVQIEQDALPLVEPERLNTKDAETIVVIDELTDNTHVDELNKLPKAHFEILNSMGFDPTNVETISARTRLETSELLATLTELEFDGWVIAEPGQKWSRLR